MNQATDIFDYVIVGAGSAGSVLANRLCEDGASVCVLESGPRDRHPYIHIPAGFIKILSNPKYTWQFKTEAGEPLGGRQIAIPQGRTLGGSSSVNGLVYNRGQRDDYDNWAARGNNGWRYADVLPYFIRSENRLGLINDRYRGTTGELHISDIDWQHPLCDAFIDGVKSLGIPANPDHNADLQIGVGYYQRTIYKTRRWSTARAFLHPAERRYRKTLKVITDAQCHHLLFEDRRAVGVEYCHSGDQDTSNQIRARREVIVSAGTVNSARLLQISGIGPGPLLNDLGVPIIATLPGVGENFQDHFGIRMVAAVSNTDSINDRVKLHNLSREAINWALRRPSVLGLSPSLAHVFWKSRPELQRPDLQFTFTPASYAEGQVGLLDKFPGVTCGTWQHRPESTGYVRAKSTNIFDPPAIQPNYLGMESDRRVLLAGIRLARQFLNTDAMRRFSVDEKQPGAAATSDDDLLDWARETGSTTYHLVGTCRMGPESDPTAVVDNQLRVRGVDALRVVDASVMPCLTSGNTNAATIMIAEKAADMIRGRRALSAAEV